MVALALQNAPRPRSAHFLHLTDLHFWRVVLNPLRLLNKRFIGNANVMLRRRRELLTNQAPAFLDYIAGLGVRDVVITGDLTSTSDASEFEIARDFVRELVRRGMAPRVIPGNHDVYTFESARRRRFEKYLGEWAPGEALPAAAPLSNGFPVIYVPTVCPNLLSSKGRIRPSEIEAVRAALAAAAAPAIVAGHYPVLEKTYGYTTTPNRRLRDAAELAAALLGFHGRMLYLSGHVHRFSLVRDPICPTLTHLTSGALFRHDKFSGHTGDFSEVRLGPDGFKIRRHRFHDTWIVSDATAGGAET